MDIFVKALEGNWHLVLLEVFGYIGTALVLLSMMMTSLSKLRIVNIAGSVVSMTYAAISNTWPVAFLNFGLIIINVIQLVRLHRLKSMLKVVQTDTNDANVDYFVGHYLKDIKLYFPDFTPESEKGKKAFIVYDGAEAIGILIGEEKDGEIFIALDYVSPKYRDRTVARFLFGYLKGQGVKSLKTAPTSLKKHQKYLIAMGFKSDGEKMVKTL